MTLDRIVAELVKSRALLAVKSLTSILNIEGIREDEALFEAIRRGVGCTIGDIEMHILGAINRRFPDLDDL